MISFLQQLGARALGQLPSVVPAVEPLFASRPTLRAVTYADVFADEPAVTHRAQPADERQLAVTQLAKAAAPLRGSSTPTHGRVTGWQPPSPRAVATNDAARLTELSLRDRAASVAPALTSARYADVTLEETKAPLPPPQTQQTPARAAVTPTAIADPVQSASPQSPAPAPTGAYFDRDEVVRELLSSLRMPVSSRAEPAARSEASVTPQVVRVTIGRVEVRMPSEPAPVAVPRRREPAAPRSFSLEDFLARKPGAHR
jgi:hypothetical protein